MGLLPQLVAMANVGWHRGDSNIIYLDGEQGRLITQGTLKEGHISGGSGQRVLWTYSIQGSWERQVEGLLAVTYHNAATNS